MLSVGRGQHIMEASGRCWHEALSRVFPLWCTQTHPSDQHAVVPVTEERPSRRDKVVHQVWHPAQDAHGTEHSLLADETATGTGGAKAR